MAAAAALGAQSAVEDGRRSRARCGTTRRAQLAQFVSSNVRIVPQWTTLAAIILSTGQVVVAFVTTIAYYFHRVARKPRVGIAHAAKQYQLT